ncbi:hypothetical protein LCGC14_1813970, partial [marine sediment metagenome]
SALAELEEPPSALPIRIQAHSFLLGRLLFQKSATTATQVDTVFETIFLPTQAATHSNLSGLTVDADHPQYTLIDGSRAFTGNTDFGGFNITNVGTLAGTLSTITQNNVTTMTGLTTIGTLIAGAVPASLVTAGTFSAGDYVFPADVTTSASFVSTGGGATGKFLTGGAGATVFAFSGANFDIRAGDGMQSSQNVLRVTSAGAFDFQSNTVSMGTLTIDDTNEWLLLTDTGTSGSVDMTFQNGTTGTGAAGFQIGITASEKAILLNYENTDMLFHTNNTLAATLAPGGNLTLVGGFTATTGTFSGTISLTATSHRIISNTSDASDTKRIGIGGGGSFAEIRGALIDIAGNEFSTIEGRLLLAAGNSGVAAGQIEMKTGGSDRFIIASDGDFDFKTGKTKFNTIEYTWPGSDGGSGNVLSTNGSGILSWTAGGAGALGGSGTAGTIAKWSAAATLTDSIITESGTDVTIAGDLIATGVGPHAIGGASDLDYGLRVRGAISAAAIAGTRFTQDFTGQVDTSAFGIWITPGITEAASGTHAVIATLAISEPGIINAGATVTDAATVYIVNAPTEGSSTNNALLVASGSTTLQALIATTGTFSGALGGTLSTAAQANITSLGTLTSLDMGGDIDLNTNNIIAGAGASFTQVTASTGVIQGANNSAMILSGGTGISNGATIVLYGESHATQDGDFEFRDDTTVKLWYDSSQSVFQVNGNLKITSNIGFFNTVPLSKQTITGSRDSNPALAILLTALAAYGLLVDSSSI